MFRRFILLMSVACTLTLTTAAAVGATTILTRPVSVTPLGAMGNQDSSHPSVSADGQIVAFASSATNLVAGDTNGVADVFRRDMQTGSTTLVSVATDGTKANGPCRLPAMSADGRFVVFDSTASNLVPGDVNGKSDIFMRDTLLGTTTLVSVGEDGTRGDSNSYDPAISPDGRYVSFYSGAANLVSGDTLRQDVFVKDMVTSKISRVSNAVGGREADDDSGLGPSAVSTDGRYVAFYSNAGDLVEGDVNHITDVFVRDTIASSTVLASVSTSGRQGNGPSGVPAISPNGQYVVFHSAASTLVDGDTNGMFDVFVRDLVNGTTQMLSVGPDGAPGNGMSCDPQVSPDGRFVAFYSTASNLVDGDTNGAGDIFVRDTQAGVTTRVSVAWDGSQATGASGYPLALSADGRRVAFDSWAANLATGDANGRRDVFLNERAPAAVTLLDTAPRHIRWGDRVTVSGTVLSGGVAVPSARVLLQYSRDGHRYQDSSEMAVADTQGAFSFSTTPVYAAWYRVVFLGSGLYSTSISDPVRVVVEGGGGGTRGDYARPGSPDDPDEQWAPIVGGPVCPGKVIRGASFKVRGEIDGWRGTDDTTVRIYKYRYISGHWKSRGYVKAKQTITDGASCYSAQISLPQAGRWKLRACIVDVKGSASWSKTSRYVTVSSR